MKNAREEYQNALAEFSQPGNRWATKGELTYWGKAAGLTAEDIIADARAAGVTDRDGDIRRGYADAPEWRGRRETERVYRQSHRQKKPTNYPHYVRHCIHDLDYAVNGNIDWVREMSPSLDWIDQPPEEQTRLFLATLYGEGDKLHIFRNDIPTAGKPGENILTAAEWQVRCGDIPGDLLIANPLTGELGETTDGKKSYIAQSCIARYPYLIVEFDDMPLPMQYAFWRGLILAEPLAKMVASITFSGGKSLHGILNVGADSLAEWTAARAGLISLLAADPDPKFRADVQAMRPRQGTRLPGVVRYTTGRMQELVYLNPEAVRKEGE